MTHRLEIMPHRLDIKTRVCYHIDKSMTQGGITMSYKHYNEMVDAEVQFDTGTQRYIFLEACYRSDSKGICWMPQSHFASALKLSPRTVAREFVRLQELGLLEKASYGHYQVVMPESKESTAPKPTPLRAKVLRWIREDWGEETIKEGEEITILDDSDQDIPNFFDEAINKGYLEPLGQSVWKGHSATQYKIHLNPQNSFE